MLVEMWIIYHVFFFFFFFFQFYEGQHMGFDKNFWLLEVHELETHVTNFL